MINMHLMQIKLIIDKLQKVQVQLIVCRIFKFSSFFKIYFWKIIKEIQEMISFAVCEENVNYLKFNQIM